MALFAFSAQADLSTTKPKYPVIFVHGIRSDSEAAWGSFRRMLVENGWFYGGATKYDSSKGVGSTVKVWQGDPKDAKDLTSLTGPADFYTVNFSSNRDLSFPNQAYELGKIVKKVSEANGKGKVILVGHSMGGLAARAYLQNKAYLNFEQLQYGDEVYALITVGTPHQGSWEAKKCEVLSSVCLWGFSSNSSSWSFGVGLQSLVPGSEGLVGLNNYKLNEEPIEPIALPSKVAYTSIVVKWPPTKTVSSVYQTVDPMGQVAGSAVTWIGGWNFVSGDDGDGIVTATSQDLSMLKSLNKADPNWIKPKTVTVNFPATVPPWCGWHIPAINEVHTCETSWPVVWDKLLRAVLEIPDPMPDAKPLSDRLDPMVFTGSASRQVVAGGTDQYVISGLAFHPQDAIQVTCEYGPTDSFPLLSSRANGTIAVIQHGAVGSFECRIPTATLTNAGSTLSVPANFEMIPFSYRVVATRLAP